MKSLDLAAALNVPELPAYLERVERKLGNVLASDNPHIQEPTTRLLKARGKRLRPSLVIAVAALKSKKIDDTVMTACVAVELIHIASLVHDDIIDNADSRWNISTINRREGVDRAIIVGDYLLARAFEQAASVSPNVAQTIAKAFAAMCDGQTRELADIGNLGRTQASYLQAINGKTAALFSAACRIGALCAGMTASQVEEFSSYGENFGMAFQLIDDALDFISTPELMGKPVGTDIREGVYTFPLIFGLANPGGKDLQRLLQKSDAFAAITNILTDNGSIEKTTLEAQKYNQSAATSLKRFAANKAAASLTNFPETYQNWALKNLSHRIFSL